MEKRYIVASIVLLIILIFINNILVVSLFRIFIVDKNKQIITTNVVDIDKINSIEEKITTIQENIGDIKSKLITINENISLNNKIFTTIIENDLTNSGFRKQKTTGEQ